MSISAKQKLEERALQAEQMIQLLTKQINQIKIAAVDKHKDELRQENVALRREVDRLKSLLVQTEKSQGIPQYYDFTKKTEQSASVTPGTKEEKPVIESQTKAEVGETKPRNEKPKKEKSDKPEKKEKGGGGGKKSEDNVPVDVRRLDFRVGRIVEASKHPDADSLYVEKVDVGEEKHRVVVSGLVRFIPEAEMQNRMVVLLCNLKPAKMRGVTSEAMVMCASTPDKVEILSPPEGSQPGDVVECDSYPRNPDSVLNPKKKIFETCAPDLRTDGDLVATYKGIPLKVPGKGIVKAQTLANVQIK